MQNHSCVRHLTNSDFPPFSWRHWNCNTCLPSCWCHVTWSWLCPELMSLTKQSSTSDMRTRPWMWSRQNRGRENCASQVSNNPYPTPHLIPSPTLHTPHHPTPHTPHPTPHPSLHTTLHHLPHHTTTHHATPRHTTPHPPHPIPTPHPTPHPTFSACLHCYFLFFFIFLRINDTKTYFPPAFVIQGSWNFHWKESYSNFSASAGSNGAEFMFLLKGHEDLRQDERVMQLFGLVNTLLASDQDTSKRHLRWDWRDMREWSRTPSLNWCVNSGRLEV